MIEATSYVVVSWDGLIGVNNVKLYVDDMTTPISTQNAIALETNLPSFNLAIGRGAISNINFFNDQLDQIEIYDRVISPIPDKYLIQHKYHNGTSWQTTTPTEENFIQYGMNNLDHITEAQWQELAGEKSIVMWSDFEDKQYAAVVLNKEPFTAKDLLGESPQVLYYTESNPSQIVVETGVDSYSVYDYISDLPTVLAYTESTEDIIVSTTTEPLDGYRLQSGKYNSQQDAESASKKMLQDQVIGYASIIGFLK
ncbi:LamG domain-containing protein [Lysinibacillus piscis]|uniref:SPOR domain-containing protein n=1 Tax=Lysinibacillus piscis TaxID=2518931 RepID=A0ABQ5NES6_9BACI|nr:LamG domain-containing protein [Lysinibacillus sp. KH24]GLC86893.1 hypothetical protein LYSBPC_00200 [Lysinibacillus sp. KH24]